MLRMLDCGRTEETVFKLLNKGLEEVEWDSNERQDNEDITRKSEGNE